jgi:AmmeMemoRadiSam system protein A
VVGVEPLWRSVRDNAVNAAFHDPRFPPLEPSELDDVEIEISALTPLRPVSTPEEVRVGVHGVMIERGPYRGLLLPQVAVEYGWDRETFLDHTCRKAGLAPGCWKDPATRIEVFSADVFSEGELLGGD